jgi:DNA-binding IclR family transcriptional regulator
LEIYYQQRHLLAHHEGIVDQRYIERSGDKTYHVGQRIVVTPANVKHMRDLISKVANQLRKSSAVQSS